jgi:hypothetical protein
VTPRVIPPPGLSTGELGVLVAAWFVACGAALGLGLALARRRWPQ